MTAASSSASAPSVARTVSSAQRVESARRDRLASCLAARSVHRAPPRAFLPLELVEEAVDGAALPGVVLEGLADERPARSVGERADVAGAAAANGLLAVGLDLRVPAATISSRSPLAFLAHLGDDLRALLPRLLAQARGLVAGLGELGLVLLERRLGLGLRVLGLLDAALDGLAALFQNLVDVREELLGEEAKTIDEGDQADDELGDVRDERVLRLLRRQMNHAGSHQCLPSVGLSSAVRSAEDERHDQADQGERLAEGEAEDLVGRIRPAASGWRARAWVPLTEDDADADAGADGGEAVADRAEVAGRPAARSPTDMPVSSFSFGPVGVGHRTAVAVRMVRWLSGARASAP